MMNVETKRGVEGSDTAHWEMRQKNDGQLVSITVLAAVFFFISFLANPNVYSRWCVGFALFGVVASCVRLFGSAAKVVASRNAVPAVVRKVESSPEPVFSGATLQSYEGMPTTIPGLQNTYVSLAKAGRSPATRLPRQSGDEFLN